MSLYSRRNSAKAEELMLRLEGQLIDANAAVNKLLAEQKELLDAEKSAELTKADRLERLRNLILPLGTARRRADGFMEMLNTGASNRNTQIANYREKAQARIDEIKRKLDKEILPYAQAKAIIDKEATVMPREDEPVVKGKRAAKNAAERRRQKKKKVLSKSCD